MREYGQSLHDIGDAFLNATKKQLEIDIPSLEDFEETLNVIEKELKTLKTKTEATEKTQTQAQGKEEEEENTSNTIDNENSKDNKDSKDEVIENILNVQNDKEYHILLTHTINKNFNYQEQKKVLTQCFKNEEFDKIDSFDSFYHKMEDLLKNRFLNFNSDKNNKKINFSKHEWPINSKLNQLVIDTILEMNDIYKDDAKMVYQEWMATQTKLKADAKKKQIDTSNSNKTLTDTSNVSCFCEYFITSVDNVPMFLDATVIDQDEDNSEKTNEVKTEEKKSGGDDVTVQTIKAQAQENTTTAKEQEIKDDKTDKSVKKDETSQVAADSHILIKPRRINYLVFLRNLFFQIGVFWEICEEMRKLYQTTKVLDDLTKLIQKYSDVDLVNLCFVNPTHQSLFHIVTAYDMSDIFDLFVDIDNDIAKYKDIYGQVLFCYFFLF